jgi:pyridoxal phosphate enzyme (YggS family)
MSIELNVKEIHKKIQGKKCTLIAVSKTKPETAILSAYEAGQLDFGENKVQELLNKKQGLPQNIRWHLIGHLQRNKVKQVVGQAHLIHSVDSVRLLKEIQKQSEKNNLTSNLLLQVHIAEEDTKFGFSEAELDELLGSDLEKMNAIRIKGLMGMATFTEDREQVRKEFRNLKKLFEKYRESVRFENVVMEELSMGMSNDFELALEEGSTMIRVGSAIFGTRNY